MFARLRQVVARWWARRDDTRKERARRRAEWRQAQAVDRRGRREAPYDREGGGGSGFGI